jgi:hypothetical protein
MGHMVQMMETRNVWIILVGNLLRKDSDTDLSKACLQCFHDEWMNELINIYLCLFVHSKRSYNIHILLNDDVRIKRRVVSFRTGNAEF